MRPSVKKLLLFGTTAPYADAMLALDFVGSRSAGQAYYMLNGVSYPSVTAVPGWTYTGGTPAGTGSYAPKADGSLQFFPSVTNLLLQSQTFDNASWVKSGSTVVANNATAPDGTLTADTITFSSGVGDQVYQSQTLTAATYQLSVYAKVASGSRAFRLKYYNGTIDAYSSPFTATTDWQRFTFSITGVAAAGNVSISQPASPVAGDIIVWGAQLELGSTASTYIPTTTAAVTVAPPRITDAGYLAEESRTNIALQSNDATNSNWLKINSTAAASAVVAPTGQTAIAVIPANGSPGGQAIQSGAITVANTSTYTFSTIVKAATGLNGGPGYAWIELTTASSATKRTWFNIQTGAIGTTGHTSAAITPMSNGFYRLAVTYSTTATTETLYVSLRTADGSSAAITGDGTTVGYYIAHEQLELGSFATSPIPTTSVAVTRSADVGYISGLTVPSAVSVFTSHVAPAYSALLNAIADLSDGSMANRAYNTQVSSNAYFNVAIANVAGTSVQIAVPSTGNVGEAFSFVGSNMQASANGSAASTAATSVPTGLNRLSVGTRPDQVRFVNTFIRRIVIYPRAMSNSELQAVTTAGAY